MPAQPSPSRQTYTRYRDAGDASDVAPGGGRSAEAAGTGQSQRLLQEVLGETLIRHQENSDQLLEVLRDAKLRHVDDPCDEALFVRIATAVLQHRLGARARQLPADLYDEVGRALWTNDYSRRRIEGFWNSLGAES
ncbi:hypothetical protein Enr13x_55000 [Stieleria neptunia]|uniref:Uncharacterized protein n=1 Tax=Stieleria neptunia TaxID=2527979 RepID=A0A518HXP0_9BACT|nr:hypothetical protein [Stieleria neptunia]QDV45621.1 hypothetical protein Enr13x_55000 [Stieleria neptunia]